MIVDNSKFKRLCRQVCLFAILASGSARADIAAILAKFNDAQNPYVLVGAHRGGYLSDSGPNLPENSLPAMERSITNGVEILEIDLYRTSDGQLVVMHDATVNRTTNGTGAVSSLTLAQIKALRLKDPAGNLTNEQVPTFSEVMTLAKGRVMVNVDKLDVSNATSMAEAVRVLRVTQTVDHAIFKGSNSASAVKTAFAPFPEHLIFMPVITDSTKEGVIAKIQDMVSQGLDPAAIEIIFTSDQTTMLAPEVIAYAESTDTRIWVDSLWASLNGGHYDAMGVAGDPESSWGWLLDHGANMILTDHADSLMRYLANSGLRVGSDVPPLYSIDYDFRDGTMQGWSNQSPASNNPSSFAPDPSDYTNRIPAVSGTYKIAFNPFSTGRDGYHQTIVLRSPGFHLSGLKASQTIEFSLLGGKGAASAAPAGSYDLAQNAGPAGFLGVALRRSSDGKYLLLSRRTTDAQGQNWQRTFWNAAQLASVTQNDSADEVYTLDLVDSYGPASSGGTLGWSWIAMDAVSVPWVGGPPTYAVDYDFRDGSLQGWSNQSPTANNPASFVADASDYTNRIPAVTGNYKIAFNPFLTGRDGYHQTIVLRSPEFPLAGLRENQTIGFSLLGGKGAASAAPVGSSSLPLTASPTGFLGVALRRVSDGKYLLSARRTADAQGQNWQRTTWTSTQLTNAIQNDAASELYTLDLIDSYGASTSGGTQGWSWIGMDAVSIPLAGY